MPAAGQLPEFLPLDYPQRLNAAAELLKGGEPDDLAIVNSFGRWTYAQLSETSGKIARLLVDEGVVPGTRILLRGPNGYMMFAAWLAALSGRGCGNHGAAAHPPPGVHPPVGALFQRIRCQNLSVRPLYLRALAAL